MRKTSRWLLYYFGRPSLTHTSFFYRPRGPKKHLKRLNAPKHWNLAKMGGVFAPRPSAGPHKLRECVPVAIILRERLKYALTGKECSQICMERNVKIDGKVRTDCNFPCGFMDVIELEKAGDLFRVMFDTKGRFVMHKIKKDEAQYKLCRVNNVMVTAKKIPVAVTHDGRTIRYPDPDVKVNDTVKVNIATGKMSDILKFELGAMVTITKGRNTGRVGQIMHVEHHDNSFDIVSVKDSKGHTFATRMSNVFVIGSGSTPQVTLPKGRGIKKTIIEERAEAQAAGRL
ncbi:small subunit ribosomal protein S4e [Fistulifera solaris]|uniref:40S ribosomal protein S4 n=1 Tax=Fistulifera solaris TaxID=1519565 RepID=A0A1Z5JPP9_FISSO|nr:small subunit ribosomal protein S4e [Fistulifera solaris]|eukprot:GAX15812.1 small subunit ribosomal protein S4e [Fistulifera solaris]